MDAFHVVKPKPDVAGEDGCALIRSTRAQIANTGQDIFRILGSFGPAKDTPTR